MGKLKARFLEDRRGRDEGITGLSKRGTVMEDERVLEQKKGVCEEDVYMILADSLRKKI